MRCVLVSHTHWDREWYHTFQKFRARLVDAIDRVLDLVRDDPGFRFLLDGQTVVLEDYLEIRPDRRAELERACRERRITIGPWYVQPDSLLPSGETHVRNLLEGRRVGRDFGGVSRIAYTPDSFGHPAQLPQILRGFDLEPFVYWRGNGAEIDDLPAEYLWEAPDGTAILVHHLAEGYFGAAGLPGDALSAALFLQKLATKLGARTRNGRVLFMNGIDHAAPDAGAARAVEALRRATGWDVRRGVLEDFADELPREGPVYRGELVGGRIANLLPGVWSTRLPQKLRNREAESRLLLWAEPWSAIAARHGLADERPALRTAWRSLLLNQAHDSICGCSQDRVHEQNEARWDDAIELAQETTTRALERLAGLDGMRRRPWDVDLDVAVFNPSPHVRTDVVRFALDPDMWVEFRGEIERSMQVHPVLGTSAAKHGYTADGAPVRVVGDAPSTRMRLDPNEAPIAVELVARDVPAFGWRRYRLVRSEPCPDALDDGFEIAADDVAVTAGADGTFDVRFGAQLYRRLGALEDRGDRGDTYDFDPVESAGGGAEPRIESVRVRRSRHPSGLALLRIERDFSTPASLDDDRSARTEERVTSRIVMEARVAPGVPRVDLDVWIENRALDHRLRLLFPTGAPVAELFAASTCDVVRRTPGPQDATGWVHPAPATFVQQGFVSAGGLTVGAPGLPEAEVTADGTIAITLVRAVGWLARMDLASRPIPAGPVLPTPGAQCLAPFRARLSLQGGLEPQAVRDFEAGFLAVPAGSEPRLAPDRAMLEIEPKAVLLETLKPAEERSGIVLRLLNPTDRPEEATVRFGFTVGRVTPLRLDEIPLGSAAHVEGESFRTTVPPHALRSFLLT